MAKLVRWEQKYTHPQNTIIENGKKNFDYSENILKLFKQRND